MGVRFRLSNRRFKKDFNQKCPLNWHAPTLLSSSLMTESTSLETRSLPSSRPPTSMLSPSGPDSSPVPSRTAAGGAAEEAKEEEKKPESSSESDEDMGFDMFGQSDHKPILCHFAPTSSHAS